jgi:hypothetical protein
MSKATIIIILLGVSLIGCGGPTVERVDFSEYLERHDPLMKSKRDEIIASISKIESQTKQLEALKNTYKSGKAQALASQQHSRLSNQLISLQGLLSQIDADIEMAIVAREISSADGGGLVSEETEELLKKADQILAQSADSSNDVASLFSGRSVTSSGSSASSRAEFSLEEPEPTNHYREATVAPGGGIPKPLIPKSERQLGEPTDLWANLRAEPSAEGRIVMRIERGQSFWVGSNHPDPGFESWYRINTRCGKIGWMHRVAIQLNSN